MDKLRRFVVVVGLGLLLASCATPWVKETVWYKPNSTKEEETLDLYNCRRDAAQVYPGGGFAVYSVSIEWVKRCMTAHGWRVIE